MISKDVPTRTLSDRWQAGMSGCDEKGIVFIAVIGLIAIIALLGTVAVITTTTEIKISSNYKTSAKALYAAQAGIEEARARLNEPSSDPNYAGDPVASPNQAWTAYILTSSSWQTSDDPNYIGTYTNYIPTTSSHTNTTVGTNTIQTTPYLSYWAKIRHKREADLLPNESYSDYATSTTNAIIYYGYATSTATTLEHFTTDETNPDTASPVEIITSYGSSGNSSSNIEIHAKKPPAPLIHGGMYGNTIVGAGDIIINGNDNCTSDSVPAVSYVTSEDFEGAALTLTSDAGTSTQVASATDLATHVDALEYTATRTLGDADDPTENTTWGSSSDYEVMFCDATQLTDSQLSLDKITGYGTLVVRGDVEIAGTSLWNGIIIASGKVTVSGNGTFNGTILADDFDLSGTVVLNYDSCEIENAKSSNRYSTFRWEDKKMN